MCYPQGTTELYNNYSHWNAQIPLSTVDDVGFISSLALYLANKYNIDINRIFVVVITSYSIHYTKLYESSYHASFVCTIAARFSSVAGCIGKQSFRQFFF